MRSLQIVLPVQHNPINRILCPFHHVRKTQSIHLELSMNSGGPNIFIGGGGVTKILFDLFSRKLHENEEILARTGVSNGSISNFKIH